MMKAHYCHGKIPIAFVFSVPGAAEAAAGKPLAGPAGKNFAEAIKKLNHLLADRFASSERYDYRITNAWACPIAKSLGDSSSEAKDSEILSSTNAARIRDELAGCSIAVLSGRKAQLLANSLGGVAKNIIQVPHIGNAGLNSIKLTANSASTTPHDRCKRRIERWSRCILKQLEV